MKRLPFTDLVDEKYIASFGDLKSQKNQLNVEKLEKKYLDRSKSLVNEVRRWDLPITHPIRRQLWQHLINHRYGTSIKISTTPEKQSPSEGDGVTPVSSPMRQSLLVGYELADRRLQSTYHLNSRGKAVLLSLLHEVSVSYPQIVYAPQTWPLLALFLHYIRPKEAIACLYALLDQPDMVIQSKGAWRDRCLSLERLGAAGFSKRAFKKLPKNEDAKNQLAVWPIAIWEFPFECLVSIVDCYLVEGPKVLFRVGLMLWKLAMERATLEGITNFDGIAALLESTASEFHPNRAHDLLRRAFKIRRFSQRHIAEAVHKAAGLCKPPAAGLELVDSLVMPCVLPGQRTYTAYGQVKAEFVAKGETTRYALRSAKSSTQATATVSSNLATADEILFLIDFIKDENLAQSCTPTVIFSTENDGVSLQTLFSRCETHAKISGHPETIILVRTATGGGLVGSFCSHLWVPGSEWSFYGNGQCFLFRLRPAPSVAYQWDEKTGLEKFQRATSSFLEVGGGLDSGPGGLRLNSNLEIGESGSSPTFASVCLIKEEQDRHHAASVSGKDFCSFKISAVEVLGFTTATPEVLVSP